MDAAVLQQAGFPILLPGNWGNHTLGLLYCSMQTITLQSLGSLYKDQNNNSGYPYTGIATVKLKYVSVPVCIWQVLALLLACTGYFVAAIACT